MPSTSGGRRPHWLYGEEVLDEWSAFHVRHFGACFRIVRSTLDEALTPFKDGSVNLLHIDGFHTYAVGHDFKLWAPKLSSKAVVLQHDVNVREREFGLWRLSEELHDRSSSVVFLHRHRLALPVVSIRPLAFTLRRHTASPPVMVCALG